MTGAHATACTDRSDAKARWQCAIRRISQTDQSALRDLLTPFETRAAIYANRSRPLEIDEAVADWTMDAGPEGVLLGLAPECGAPLSATLKFEAGTVAYVVAERWRRQGQASALIARLVDLRQGQRIDAIVTRNNIASCHVLERAAFRFRGLRRPQGGLPAVFHYSLAPRGATQAAADHTP